MMRFRDLSSRWKKVIIFLLVVVLVLIACSILHVYLTLGSLIHVMLGR